MSGLPGVPCLNGFEAPYLSVLGLNARVSVSNPATEALASSSALTYALLLNPEFPDSTAFRAYAISYVADLLRTVALYQGINTTDAQFTSQCAELVDSLR